MGVHIIRTDDGTCLDIVHFQQLCRHIEVHDVPGVVSVKKQNPGTGFHFFGNFIDLLGGR